MQRIRMCYQFICRTSPVSQLQAGSPPGLSWGVVVASELLRDDTSTLLVRIMAGGKLLPQAVKEVRALPADAPERVIAEPALVEFEHVIGQAPDQTEDEKEFIVAVQRSWEDARTAPRSSGARARAAAIACSSSTRFTTRPYHRRCGKAVGARRASLLC